MTDEFARGVIASTTSEEWPGPRAVEFGPVCGSDPYPRYPAGEYEAGVVKVEFYRDPQFNSCKAAFHFRLTHDGARVVGFYHMGTGSKPKAGRRSEYWRAWVIANGSPPKKRQTLSPGVFKNKIFQVRVGDVTKRFDGRDHPPGAIYSTVKEIVRRTYP